MTKPRSLATKHTKVHPRAAMYSGPSDRRPAKWRALEAVWDNAEQIHLQRNLDLPLQTRVLNLERSHERAWSLLAEMTFDALDSIDLKRQREEENAPADLPVIVDRRSFMHYVAAVTSRLHMGHCTGQEARALLYAAQLALSGLKGASDAAIDLPAEYDQTGEDEPL